MMMVNATSARRLTSREVWFGVFAAALLMAGLALLAALTWYALPRVATVTVGPVSDYPPADAPHRVIVRQGDDHYALYIVNSGDMLTVFSAWTPHPNGARLVWVPANQRFEDPVTASKFTLSGQWIEGPAARHMDRYTARIVDGMLVIDNRRGLLKGQPRAGHPHAWTRP